MGPIGLQLCELGRRAYARSLVAGTEGNFSLRLHDDRILCTPTGLCKGLMRPEDLCVLTLAGKQVSGRRRHSSEILVHLAIYSANPKVRAVVHTHPPFATTFAVVGEPLPRGILPEAEMFLGEVPLVPYATTGTADLANAVRPFAREHVAVLLQNHGAVTWGGDLELAYGRTEVLEAVCRVLHQARQIGVAQPIPEAKLAELRLAAASYLAAQRPR